MSKDIIQQVDALEAAAKRLVGQCDDAIAHIEKMEAKAVEFQKRQMAIIESMFAAIEAVHKPKEGGR